MADRDKTTPPDDPPAYRLRLGDVMISTLKGWPDSVFIVRSNGEGGEFSRQDLLAKLEDFVSERL